MLSAQALADYCIALHRKNSEQLGLLPADRMRAYVDAGQVFHAEEGGDVCGYLIAGMTPPWARVWQACVEYTVRGLGHGAVMVAKLEAEAKRRGCTGITLRCRDGLDSNLFWQALGFTLVRQVPGGGRRGKPLNVWALQINDDLLGVAMERKPNSTCGVVASQGAGWCEHCGEGVTDFCRGKLRLCPKGLPVLHRNAGVRVCEHCGAIEANGEAHGPRCPARGVTGTAGRQSDGLEWLLGPVPDGVPTPFKDKA